MDIGFDLEEFVDEKYKPPGGIDVVYYTFWEKGISYNEFKELPIPYIFSILKTHSWVKKEEEKAYKKANKK